MSVIVGVRIPTPFRHRQLEGRRRTGVVGTWNIRWYHHQGRVGYRGREVGEDREEEEQLLSSTGKTRPGWEPHDLAREFCVCDTIGVHDLRICYATKEKGDRDEQ